MRLIHRPPGHLRSVTVGLIALGVLAACTSWELADTSPAELVRTEAPETIRLTRIDSTQIELRAPTLHGDTLVGTVGGGLARGDTVRYIAVPLSAVRSIEVRRSSAAATVALLAIILAIAQAIFATNYPT